MITRMKKLSFLIHSKEYDEFLEQLRSLGVVHVVQKQAGAVQDESLQEDLNLLSRYKNALKVLETVPMGTVPFGTVLSTESEPDAVSSKTVPNGTVPIGTVFSTLRAFL